MKIIKLIPILIFALGLGSCSNKNDVNLSETNCRDEVPVLGNFTFVFDKNLVADSLLNRWLDVEYLEFKPFIPGKFQWKNSNELIFSPENELMPATSYTAKFNKELVKNTKYKIGGLEDIKFYTPHLALNSTNGSWVSREALSSGIIPEIALTFNYSVDPAELENLITLKNGTDKLEYKIMSQEVGPMVILRINNLKAEDKDLNLKLTIDKGLKPKGGVTGSEKQIEAEVFLSSPFNLIVSGQEADHDGITGTIKLFTSQKISTESEIAAYISIVPELKFKSVVMDDGIVITSDAFDVTKTYEVVVKKGLKGMVGGTLKEQYSNSIAFGKLEPSINFMDSKGVYMASKGKRNLEIKINNVKEVKVTISKIYERPSQWVLPLRRL